MTRLGNRQHQVTVVFESLAVKAKELKGFLGVRQPFADALLSAIWRLPDNGDQRSELHVGVEYGHETLHIARRGTQEVARKKKGKACRTCRMKATCCRSRCGHQAGINLRKCQRNLGDLDEAEQPCA
jgi:hypothetical protein